MEAQPGEDRPAVLHEAQAIVAEQLKQLRSLAESTRREHETLRAELRKIERRIDEAVVQHRSAVQWNAPTAQHMGQRVAHLRAQAAEVGRKASTSQHALKQLDQLMRQIEMSSGALSDTGGASSDPWVLALRAQVIHGREEERVRLAREVHDGPAQVLANTLMLLETCYTLAQSGDDSAKLVLMLDRMRGATREGMQEVRRFIANLRTGTIAQNGLVAALKEFLHEYVHAYHARVSFDAEAIPRLPDEVEIVLYRIVQETLQNAHKYARGASVHVRLAVQMNKLHLTIRDEGPGFDPHEVARRAGRSNWGLTSMRERAELIGAKFMVASRPGHGTEVSVVLPIN